jgi:ribonucleoside-triphosphate reductase (formate)
MYNLEATPAEGTTYRFAREDKVNCRASDKVNSEGREYPLVDKKQISNIIQAGTLEAPYYTNSTQLPV